MKKFYWNSFSRIICLIGALIISLSFFPVRAQSDYVLVHPEYEEGRYAVFSGISLASTNDIRSISYIAASESVQLEIPSGFSVTIHQYQRKSVESFIISKSAVVGSANVALADSTRFIRLSIKKQNNSTIAVAEGAKIKLFVHCNTDDLLPIDSIITRWESGRYAVYTGKPIPSSINIRSVDFIPVQDFIQVDVPDSYSVSVHQYKEKSYASFIASKSALIGQSVVSLDENTRYVKLSIKKKDNSSISTNEGKLIGLKEYNESMPASSAGTTSTQWESGRYAVGTGNPISSPINVRSRNFIPVSNEGVSLNIPYGYTVTIHEYSADSFTDFVKSTSGLKENVVVQLADDTQFITYSMKKINNSEIAIDEGNLLTYSCVTIPDNKPVAMLTIIDDDANIRFYRDIYPLAVQKKVSISAAVPASFPGRKNCMTWDMVKECQNSGIEILCHTYSHPLTTQEVFNNMTEEDFYSDYSKAIDIFSSHGISSDLLVFSGSTGLYDKAQNPAHQLFKGAFWAGDNRTNQNGFDPYRIRRYRIGSDYAWDAQTLKNLVDSLKESGGWMVWMMHTSDSARYTSDVPSVLAEVIDYCKDQDVDIVTAEYGFEHCGK